MCCVSTLGWALPQCSGSTVPVLFEYCTSTLVVLWHCSRECCASTLGVLHQYSGSTVAVLWEYSDSTLGQCTSTLGVVCQYSDSIVTSPHQALCGPATHNHSFITFTKLGNHHTQKGTQRHKPQPTSQYHTPQVCSAKYCRITFLRICHF